MVRRGTTEDCDSEGSMSNDFKQGLVNCGFLIGGFTVGAIVCAMDGSPYQPWVSIGLMGLGGLVCARVAMR